MCLIPLFRTFILYRLNNYVHAPKPCNHFYFISRTFILLLFYFQSNRVRFILAMWTRAICNSLDLFSRKYITVNKYA